MRAINKQFRMVVALALVVAITGVFSAAQDQPSNQQLLQELQALKARIQQLENQQQGTAANALSATVQSVEAKKEADAALKVATEATPVLEKLRKGQIQVGRTNVFFEGWAEYSATYRPHSEFTGPSSTNVSSFPFPNQAQYHSNEFRDGPPQTRFGLQTVSDLSDNYILRSRFQFDMLSSSNTVGTGGYNQSWTPRLRASYGEIDNVKAKWHLVLGQNYSLMVPSGNNVNPDGSPSPNLAWMLLPGTELPPVPDDTAMAGPIISTRNMQARFVKEIAPHAAVAISFENNTVGWGGDRGTGLTLPTTVSAPGLPKPVVSPANFVTPATGGLGNAYVSLGTMPDIVGKIGFDPTTRLHLEAWGVLRQFKDAPGLATDLPDAGKLYSGGGVVGFFVKIIPGKLDLQAAGGYGALGSALNNFLPDVTYDSTGKPAAIYERALGLNLIPHPHRNVDIYLMAGVEKAQQAGINGGATAANAYGYGNPGAFNGASCETLSTLTGSCAQDTQTVWNVMAEVSWRMFNSPKWGHFDAMPQVQYGRRILFRGADGIAPSTTDWATELCFRYWPW